VDEPLRVGVVGMGKMGLLHLGLLNVLPNVELVGLCEPVQLTRRILKKVLRKIHVVDDISKLSPLDLDALFITTPTRTHYAVASTVLEEGIAKNLFIEKPLSDSYEESQDLCRLIEGKGFGMVGYVRRFMVTFMKAKELLEEGVLGEIHSFSVKMYSSDFCGIKNPAASISRSGVLKDLGCYPIDLIHWYFGDFNVDSAVFKSAIGSGTVDSARFTVEENDSVPSGEVLVSWCAEGYRMPEAEFSIIGSKGNLIVNDDLVRINLKGETSTWYRLNLTDTVPFWLGAPEYYREDQTFFNAIGQEPDGLPSFDSAAKVESVIADVERRATEND
jgi:predicted dehydrogenase